MYNNDAIYDRIKKNVKYMNREKKTPKKKHAILFEVIFARENRKLINGKQLSLMCYISDVYQWIMDFRHRENEDVNLSCEKDASLRHHK